MSLHDGPNAVSLDRDLLDPGMASLSDFFSPNGAGAAIMGASDTRHYPQSILENLLRMGERPHLVGDSPCVHIHLCGRT